MKKLFLLILVTAYNSHALSSSQTAPSTTIPENAIGYKAYVDRSMIRPGQVRISHAGVQAKVKDAINNGLGNYTNQDQTLNNLFEQQNSIISENNALPVVIIHADGKDCFVLLDGHHDYLANRTWGCKFVPIEVKDDLRKVPTHELWNSLKAKGYVYATTLSGKELEQVPGSFDDLEDDPYRYFVKVAMWEAKNPTTPFEQSKPGTKGLTAPLAVKWKDKKFNPLINSTRAINKPFVEFAVADLLYKYGKEYDFSYKDGDEKDMKKFQANVEKARSILLKYMQESSIANSFNLIDSAELAEELIQKKEICLYNYADDLSSRLVKDKE